MQPVDMTRTMQIRRAFRKSGPRIARARRSGPAWNPCTRCRPDRCRFTGARKPGNPGPPDGTERWARHRNSKVRYGACGSPSHPPRRHMSRLAEEKYVLLRRLSGWFEPDCLLRNFRKVRAWSFRRRVCPPFRFRPDTKMRTARAEYRPCTWPQSLVPCRQCAALRMPFHGTLRVGD